MAISIFNPCKDLQEPASGPEEDPAKRDFASAGNARRITRPSVLIAPYGSVGDVAPLVQLGVSLRNSNADVTIAVNPVHRQMVEEQNLRLLSVGTIEGAQRLSEHPLLWHRQRGFRVVAGSAIQSFRSYFGALSERQENFDLVVSGSFGWAAAAFAEKMGVPHVRVHLTPAYLQPRDGFSLLLDGTREPLRGGRLARLAIRTFRERVVLRKLFLNINKHRTACGLRPLKRLLSEVFSGPGKVAALFPEWFAPAKGHDGSAIRQFEFPQGCPHQHTIPAGAAEMLDGSTAPLIWTFGSMTHETGHLEELALQTSESLRVPAILVSRGRAPERLSSTCIRTDFLPLADVLPRCGAIVHHGGIGTIARALEAGIPQVVLPMAHDQPDNALRLRMSGLGEVVDPDRASSGQLKRAVQVALSRPRPRPLVVDPDSERALAEHLLSVAGRRPKMPNQET